MRQPWLTQVLGLKRLPCANTYAYVCAHLDVGDLTSKLRDWLAQVAPSQAADEWVQWAIDGKVLRGSHRYTPVAQSGQEVLNVTAVATILAVLNSAILALLAHCQVTNARRAIRTFAAFPEQALALLMQPL